MNEIRRVAVVDDSEDDRELIVWALEEAGFVPIVIADVVSVDEAVRQVQESADAIVCDHQLRWGDFATFDGAELVARCFEMQIPAVLVTAYVMDADVSIRMHRRHISGLVPRDQLDGGRLAAELGASQQELEDSPPRGRVPWRTLLRVVRVRDGGSDPMVDVVIPQWNPHRNVSFPLRLLALDTERAAELEGRRFIAHVNTGADEAADLYFEGFEDAGGVPDAEDLR